MRRLIKNLIFVLMVIPFIFSCDKFGLNIDETTATKKKVTEEEKESIRESEIAKARELLTIQPGEYQDRVSQRAMMTVSYKDQIYYFDINWGSSAWESSRWEFSGKYDITLGGVKYDNSKHTTITFDMNDENKPPVVEEVYTGGKGIMKVEDLLLYWEDEQEPNVEGEKYGAIFEMIVRGQTYTMPGYNPYPYNGYYPNETYGYTPYGTFIIPNNSYYYISGYDRQPFYFSNGQPMGSRVPILAGNYSYPTMVANRLIYNAYVSISDWCNKNILNREGVQDYFLNFASIQRETPTQIVLMSNCALKKKGVIDGNVEFRITIDIRNNKYVWRKTNNNARILEDEYEYDSGTGQIIIIR